MAGAGARAREHHDQRLDRSPVPRAAVAGEHHRHGEDGGSAVAHEEVVVVALEQVPAAAVFGRR
jgi:hypothetical protein